MFASKLAHGAHQLGMRAGLQSNQKPKWLSALQVVWNRIASQDIPSSVVSWKARSN